MSHAISIPVDVTNPGQFFACCGLLELAHRVWPGTSGAFNHHSFFMECESVDQPGQGLQAILLTFKRVHVVGSETPTTSDSDVVEAGDTDEAVDENSLASAICLGSPIDLRLDWWAEKALKPWAGSMDAALIFTAMREAVDPEHPDPMNVIRVVYDPIDASKPNRKQNKREPFYFDSRRGGNSKSLDVGFAPDAFQMISAACPAVESLCMVGLQRFRPRPTNRPRQFEYRAWTVPLAAPLAAAAVCGLLPSAGGECYRFENAFRTDQRKHKSFLPAIRVTEGDTE